MWAIVDIDQLVNFEGQQRVVGILIAQQFDREVLTWIFDSWEELHFLSGCNWHIAIPCRPSDTYESPKLANFDVQLSTRLREMYGIDRHETPVLVLDNFADEEKQLYLKISVDETERKAMFTRMSELIDERMPKIHYTERPGSAFRRALINDLYDHITRNRLWENALKFAPLAVSAAARLLRKTY